MSMPTSASLVGETSPAGAVEAASESSRSASGEPDGSAPNSPMLSDPSKLMGASASTGAALAARSASGAPDGATSASPAASEPSKPMGKSASTGMMETLAGEVHAARSASGAPDEAQSALPAPPEPSELPVLVAITMSLNAAIAGRGARGASKIAAALRLYPWLPVPTLQVHVLVTLAADKTLRDCVGRMRMEYVLILVIFQQILQCASSAQFHMCIIPTVIRDPGQASYGTRSERGHQGDRGTRRKCHGDMQK